jgi:hypothetical protein
VSGVSAATLKLFEGSVDRGAEEVLFEAGELGANLVDDLVSLFSNLFILCLYLRLFGLIKGFAYLLGLRKL